MSSGSASAATLHRSHGTILGACPASPCVQMPGTPLFCPWDLQNQLQVWGAAMNAHLGKPASPGAGRARVSRAASMQHDLDREALTQKQHGSISFSGPVEGPSGVCLPRAPRWLTLALFVGIQLGQSWPSLRGGRRRGRWNRHQVCMRWGEDPDLGMKYRGWDQN